MSKYNEVALSAARMLQNVDVKSPVEAWSKATKVVFPNRVDLQNKGCPKGAFVGLCNAGLLQGVPSGEYSSPTKNGKYATDAIEILRENRFLATQPELLWKKVAGNTKSGNHQMDVVVGLWEANFIVI